MQGLQAHATIVEPEMIERAFTTTISRRELEAAAPGDGAELLLELAESGEEITHSLAVELSYRDLEAVLRLSTEDELVLSLDGDALESVLADPEVEAHGLKGAIAIAVTGAALIAPAAQGAVPQSVNAAATAQRVHAAVSTEARPGATAQVAHAAVRPEISRAQTKAQVSKTLVVKSSVFRLLR